MPNKIIQPIYKPVNAKVSVPGSKSITNRALLIAALANGTTTLHNALFSDDSRYFARALADLGFDVRSNEAKAETIVVGLGGRIPSEKANLYIGNAGTAARFLSAFLCLGNGEYVLDGEPRMRERPIGDLIDSLAALGVEITGTRNNATGVFCPPVRLKASGLAGGMTRISGQVSSQYLSALMMVAPYAKSEFTIQVIDELNSKPYVDMTERVMADFGVHLRRDGYKSFTITPGMYNARADYVVEADASAASYFFALPAVTGGNVTVQDIHTNSIQGDIQFLEILQQMGLQVSETAEGITVTNPGVQICGIDIDMAHIPDTAQTLAAIAPFASGPTRIRGIASARVKETDRVNASCTELRRLGVQVEEYEDGMLIYPCKNILPASIQTYNDHRMAMAFSLVGVKVPGIEIEDPACVNKTFPNYFEVLESVK